MNEETDKGIEHKSNEQRIGKAEAGLSQLTIEVASHGEKLASIQTSLDTGLEHLSKQVAGLFNRTDKPTPWGVIFTGIGLLVAIGTLAFAPLYAGLTDAKVSQQRSVEHREKDAYEMGRMEVEIEWLEKMEERNYEMSHRNEKSPKD